VPPNALHAWLEKTPSLKRTSLWEREAFLTEMLCNWNQDGGQHKRSATWHSFGMSIAPYSAASDQAFRRIRSLVPEDPIRDGAATRAG